MTINYPDWNSARSSYYRRRRMGVPGFQDPFQIPENYMLTKIGVLRQHFGVEIGDEHRFWRIN